MLSPVFQRVLGFVCLDVKLERCRASFCQSNADTASPPAENKSSESKPSKCIFPGLAHSVFFFVCLFWYARNAMCSISIVSDSVICLYVFGVRAYRAEMKGKKLSM